jgi:hypothetical protein
LFRDLRRILTFAAHHGASRSGGLALRRQLSELLRHAEWATVFRTSIVVENHTAMAEIEPTRKQKGWTDVERDTSI